MQNRLSAPVLLDQKQFPGPIRADAERYTQVYQPHNFLHYHDCLEIGLCETGSGVEFIGGEIYSFSPGTLTVIPRGCVHDSHIIMKDPADPPSQWRFVFADPEALGLSAGGIRGTVLDQTELRMLFELLFQELEERQPGYETAGTALLQAFLQKLARFSPTQPPTAPDRQLLPALNLITQSYGRDLTVELMAAQCGLSVSHFRRQFRRAMGSSPLEYLNNLRISVAHHLLRTTQLSVLAISEEVGFRSLSSFNRLFKRVYDVSPRQVRKC